MINNTDHVLILAYLVLKQLYEPEDLSVTSTVNRHISSSVLYIVL